MQFTQHYAKENKNQILIKKISSEMQGKRKFCEYYFRFILSFLSQREIGMTHIIFSFPKKSIRNYIFTLLTE